MINKELDIKFVNISGRRIRHVIEGDGTPLILLHGLGRSLWQWKDYIPRFSEHFTVYAFDFPGFGHSEPLKFHERNLAIMSLFIEEFRQHFNIEKPVILGGSFGGLTAIDYALEFQQNLNKLIIMDSAGLGREIIFAYRLVTLPILGEIWRHFNYTGVGEDHKFIWKTTKIPKIGEFLEKLFDTPSPDILKNTSDSNHNTSLELIRYSINLLGQNRMIRRDNLIENIKIPTLIMWIENDPVFPLKHAKLAHEKIANSQLHIFKSNDKYNLSTKHWPPTEYSEEFFETVINFIKE